MPEPIKIRRALISVYDKTGIVEFARALHEEFGVEIISTDGTAKALAEAGIPVTLVEDITGFPEMLDGRVKTLHPKIHAAILADRDNPEHVRQLKEQGIEPIDMVVVNLYPFEETVADPNCKFEDAIEMIDIGGPSLLRAAAKNHRHVLVANEPEYYDDTLDVLRGKTYLPDNEADERLLRASYGFTETSMYDAGVAAWLGEQERISSFPWLEAFFGRNWGKVRYGENPHQEAQLIQSLHSPGGPDLTISDSGVCGENEEQPRMSFSNYVDCSAAVELCGEVERATHANLLEASRICCFIKHTNACGVGIADDSIEAFRRAYLGDPNAAMGGILALNFNVEAAFAEAVMESLQRWGKAAGAGAFFVEVWAAPSFDEAAVKIIRGRKKWGGRVRLLDVSYMSSPLEPDDVALKTIAGGMLVQTPDLVGLNEDEWKVATKREPTERELGDSRLAWLIAKHTKSNAISICKDGMLIGNGAGQMSRVMSCRIATWLAKDNGHDTNGAVTASDAFFPFRDGPDILADAGVTAIIQPGGSKRDQEVIDACNERNVAMIFTGTRHFKH